VKPVRVSVSLTMVTDTGAFSFETLKKTLPSPEPVTGFSFCTLQEVKIKAKANSIRVQLFTSITLNKYDCH
jgi:hypothetical protein